jgi:hypothetical protein
MINSTTGDGEKEYYFKISNCLVGTAIFIFAREAIIQLELAFNKTFFDIYPASKNNISPDKLSDNEAKVKSELAVIAIIVKDLQKLFYEYCLDGVPYNPQPCSIL